jgi:GxxExxY protein
MTIRRDGGLLHEELTKRIIGAFYTVHRTLGFGYREFIYSLALERELLAMGLRVEREVAVMIYYRGEPLVRQTFDMLVEGKVIVENKSIERLLEENHAQLFGYLCATTIEVGLLLHFGRKAKFYRSICENRYKAHCRRGLRRPDPDSTNGGELDAQA